ncbi:hypothetical protein [Ammonifex thiophilus]|uniref:Uncharacterized protein n=1 Tax=Ammonifex thiophilus TaxID=444093 RepID=A0A3D8P1D1_9THEO|nr:hypothetical protein [Ammonifex thiophilus]RDV81223.1 hypothetical protein DXX99_09575 [Ammonifex thiophilus]
MEVFGVPQDPATGQTLLGRVTELMHSFYAAFLKFAWPLAVFCLGAACLLALVGTFSPGLRKTAFAWALYILLGLLFLEAVPLIVGLVKYAGTALMKGGI